MPVTVVRFNLVEPGATPASLSARYRAALEMAAYADEHGITTVQTEEHHGVGNNWLPSPFAFAGSVFGATRRIAVTVSAIIGPLYDPLRLAEDIAVLDLVSGGRLVTVSGIGYRPAEYEQQGVEWGRRGKLQDELLETLLKAWTGEEARPGGVGAGGVGGGRAGKPQGRPAQTPPEGGAGWGVPLPGAPLPRPPAPFPRAASDAARRRLLTRGRQPRGPPRSAVLPE